jgi:glyceraldehyde-3-phosphate dehydrogenase/erythrose-4-phosphate dehydrogenase
LEEAELYYQSRIQERMEVLEVNKLVDEQVMSDLKEIDQSFKSIHKDLKRNPGDERLIQAVIQVYQMKLEMIDNLLQQFK